jgi:RHS repeat-associated protein
VLGIVPGPSVHNATGATTTNSFGYTGRELDATGLYFYRARYYNPALQRFISEDPVGFDGSGTNFYGYVGNSPTNANDPLGLWSPEAHDALIRHALAPCGVSDGNIRQIQQGSRDFDSDTGTSEQWAFAHSMASPGQDRDQAIQQRNSFVASELIMAGNMFQAGEQNFAFQTVGVAMHPMMDFTSPAHTAANGDPITWCAPIGCSGNVVHSPWDWTHIGIERTSDITPQDYALEDQAIRDAYSYVTRNKLTCRKQ